MQQSCIMRTWTTIHSSFYTAFIEKPELWTSSHKTRATSHKTRMHGMRWSTPFARPTTFMCWSAINEIMRAIKETNNSGVYMQVHACRQLSTDRLDCLRAVFYWFQSVASRASIATNVRIILTYGRWPNWAWTRFVCYHCDLDYRKFPSSFFHTLE